MLDDGQSHSTGLFPGPRFHSQFVHSSADGSQRTGSKSTAEDFPYLGSQLVRTEGEENSCLRQQKAVLASGVQEKQEEGKWVSGDAT